MQERSYFIKISEKSSNYYKDIYGALLCGKHDAEHFIFLQGFYIYFLFKIDSY